MVDLHLVELVLEPVELVRVGAVLKPGLVVVGGEGRLDVLGIVDEVEDERRLLAGRDPVEPRQRLHGLHPVEALVDVHGLQEGLVEAGLVFLGHQQDLVVGRVEPPRQRSLADRLARHDVGVHGGLGEILAGVGVVDGAAERHQRMHVVVAVLCDVALEGLHVAHRVQPRRRDHHRLRLPPDPVHYMVAEVLDDHRGLLLDVVRVQAQEPGERHRRAALGEVGVVGGLLDQLEVGVVVGVVAQDVEDEPLLDGLAHAVDVERLGLAARADPAEHLDGLAFGRGGEREERQVGLRAP